MRGGILIATFTLLGLACVPPPSHEGETQTRQGGAQTSEAVATAPDPFVPGVTGDEALQAELDAALACPSE